MTEKEFRKAISEASELVRDNALSLAIKSEDVTIDDVQKELKHVNILVCTLLASSSKRERLADDKEFIASGDQKEGHV